MDWDTNRDGHYIGLNGALEEQKEVRLSEKCKVS